MAPSSRRIVRSAVGLAAVAPALGLLVLAVALMMDGGLSGFLAGAVVAVVALLLLGAALLMTHAPVTIKKLLDRTDQQRAEREEGLGPNGEGPGDAVHRTADEDA